MQTTSRAACGDSTDPKDCPVLENVFQYMGGNFGSAVACGVKMGAYVSRKMNTMECFLERGCVWLTVDCVYECECA